MARIAAHAQSLGLRHSLQNPLKVLESIT